MKRFPYTETTDMVVYVQKPKKKRNAFIALCLCSALISSTITAGIIGAGAWIYVKNNAKDDSSANFSAGDISNLSTSNNNGVELSIPQIAKKVGPSCVGVVNKTKVEPQRFYDPFSRRYYYTSDPNDDTLVEQGSGSGIIISTDGYIVTNEHVVEGATEISVILNTGKEYTATLIGADDKSDLAVLKIETNGLVPANLGNSENLEVGELVVAIGNPLGQELFGTVTDGIISAVNRTMSVENRTYNLIQTNAAINPGNSGGALVDRFGNVIGINTIKLSNAEVEGIGFAIAISEAKPIIADLMNNGYVSGRPLVGITVTENRNGLSVYSIAEGSGAQNAGMQVGDLIVKADGVAINTSDKLNELRDLKQPGETITLTVIRNGELQDIKVVLGEDIPDA